MSAFRDAVQQMQFEDFVCPGCQEENIPGTPSKINRIDGDDSKAACDTCGRYGPVGAFQRVTQHPWKASV